MSQVLAPVTVPFTDPVQLGPPDSISAIRITNESSFTQSVQMNGHGGSYPVDAWGCDVIYTKDFPGWDGSITIKSLTILNNSAGSPASEVLITIFGKHETVKGTYPVGLSRLNNIGNAVNTNVTATNLLQNDGNPSNTQIIESTVSGDLGGSAVSLTNDGVFAIGTTTHQGSFTIKGTISSDNGTITTNGTGTITVVQVNTNTVDSPADGATVLSVSAGKTRLQNSTLLSLQVPGGTDRVTLSSSTMQLTNSTVFKGLTGDAIARFGNASGTGSGTVSHTLGAVPDFVAVTTHAVGSQTVGYSGETSTQITVTTGASLAWFAFLTKRS